MDRECSALIFVCALAASVAGCHAGVVVAELDGGQPGATNTDSDADADGDADSDADSDAPCSWTVEPLGLLSSVHGVSHDAVFAAGGATLTETLAFRYEAGCWNALPETGSPIAFAVTGLWTAAENDLLAVCDAFLTLRFDGDEWDATNIQTDTLTDIHGNSLTDVYAVGGLFDSLIWHFDGESWHKVQNVPSAGPLKAVWSSGWNDVYAVAYGAILHSDGTGWEQLETGIQNTPTMLFEGVWGSSAQHVLVVGQDPIDSAAAVLRWDGAAWEREELGAAGEDLLLEGVGGSGPDDVWAVGSREDAGVVLTCDGSSWSEVDGPFDFPLSDVWVASNGAVFAAGDEGVVYCDPSR